MLADGFGDPVTTRGAPQQMTVTTDVNCDATMAAGSMMIA